MLRFLSPFAAAKALLTSFCVALCLSVLVLPHAAKAASRSLTLYNTHTKETATITFKRNGRYDADGLRKLNRFLRDWRRNESTRMDPALFDLIWHVYKETGAKKPIHVVSGYRSPATNNMLRRRSRGVAKSSRHTKGQAMDFYLPGVPVHKIRNAGLRLQAGGVGYYPGSRSPFVHIDTGNVRHWPRMTRKQLARIFPRGTTVHVPRDGKPFKGYKQAKAQVAKRKAEMVRTTRAARRFTQVAKAAPSKPATSTRVARTTTSNNKESGSLFSRLLNRTPKDAPSPVSRSVAQQTVTNTQSDIGFPMRLAALPRRPKDRPTTPPAPVQEDPQADAIIAAAEVADAKRQELAAQQADTDAQEASPLTPPPLQFASLPRARQATAERTPFRLASTSEAKPLPEAPAEAPAVSASNVAASQGADFTSTASVGESQPLTVTVDAEAPAQSQERVEVASLPQPQNQAASEAVSTSEAAAQQKPDAKSILVQMAEGTGTKPLSENSSAYASAEQAILTSLPNAAPRARLIGDPSSNSEAPSLSALPRKAERTEVASLPDNLRARIGEPEDMMAMLPRRADRALPQPAVRPERRSPAKKQTHLAKLTFAYGPSGMAHFAHMKQSTKTATFARLSRPIPNNLGALVSKPDSMVDQTFSHGRQQQPQDIRFGGSAVGRLAVRSFR